MLDQIKTFFTGISLDLGMKVLGGILILIVGFIVIKCITKSLSKSKAFNKTEAGSAHFIVNMISFALKIFLVLTVAMVIGVPAASIVALIGSAGVAIGLALQGSLSNIAGGIMLVVFKPFKEGDFIDSSDGASGTVTDINVFYTTVVTPDNKVLVIPNGSLSNKPIINYSQKDTRRVDLTFGVAYDSDIEKVKNVILNTAKANEKVFGDPAPVVFVTAYQDSAIELSLRFWCKNGDYWSCYFDVNERMKKAFDENGIVIPFPQLDVHNV